MPTPPPLAPTGPPPPPAAPGGNVYGRSGGSANLLGYLSLGFGVLGTICCCCPWLRGLPFLGGIPAVVLGILHLQRVKKGEATMSWLGWVGIVLGVLALIGGIFSLTADWSDRLQDQYDQFDNS